MIVMRWISIWKVRSWCVFKYFQSWFVTLFPLHILTHVPCACMLACTNRDIINLYSMYMICWKKIPWKGQVKAKIEERVYLRLLSAIPLFQISVLHFTRCCTILNTKRRKHFFRIKMSIQCLFVRKVLIKP